MTLVEVHALRKSFPGRKAAIEAVRGISLTMVAGEIVGLLGPNGAGKTTCLRMLATLITPDGGDATIAGASLRGDLNAVRRLIGYVAQGGTSWDEVSAREELILQARFYGFGKAEAGRRAVAAIAAFRMEEFADRRCKTYSGGQRRRLDVALGTVHDPQILLLDEPTVGLDPESRADVWDLVRRLRDQGTTILMTTHYLEEADALCDRISIMDRGKIVAEGTPDQIRHEIGADVVTVGVNGVTREIASLLGTQSYVRALEVGERSVRLHVDAGASAIPQIIRVLENAGLRTDFVDLRRPSLDDAFMAMTGRSLSDQLPETLMKLARDTWLILQRQLLLLRRSPLWLAVDIVQPVAYLLLFTPLLKHALGTRTTEETYQIFVPGLLVLLAIFAAAFAGFSLIAELRAGVIERSRVTPVSRLALLLGRALRDVISLMAQSLLITLLAAWLGLSVRLVGLLLVYVLLGLIALMLASFSYAVALRLRDEDALAKLLNTVTQPVLLLSGIFLPLALAPLWLRRVAAWDPFSSVVTAARALFAGEFAAAYVWKALGIVAGLTVITFIWAARSFAKSVR